MEDKLYVTPNEFTGSDVERINQAIEAVAGTGRRVVIPRRNRTGDGERDVWVLDSAILVQSDTTLELNNCHIKLSDRSRDNMIRSANCGLGITDIRAMRGIYIYGVGNVVLKGADNPRATGDSAKRLVKNNEDAHGEFHASYGADAGVPGESQKGDWRNIGILLACVEDFRVENLKIKDSHAWAISLERCASGYIGNIKFNSREGKVIDGEHRVIRNQDGLDLREGCHDITIENLSGNTGDAMLAPTNLADPDGGEPGSLETTEVSGSKYRGESDDLYNIYMRNISGHSVGGHCLVLLLNTRKGRLYNVVLDSVIDTSPADHPCAATVIIGSKRYGGLVPLGCTRRLFISNISGASKNTILIAGTLADSFITNVVHGGETGDPVTLDIDANQMRNVEMSNLISPG
ncbi:MAG: hypothetical protein PHW60_15860 [Kiritimatiellae bacterium]|nr:hypothetical protein [Kiritimatiellia bacterium]